VRQVVQENRIRRIAPPPNPYYTGALLTVKTLSATVVTLEYIIFGPK